MRGLVRLLTALAASGLLLAGCSLGEGPSSRPGAPKPPGPSAGPEPTVGAQAPEIDGEDIDGQPFKLSDYRGKVVMLDFWGNW